MFMGALIALLAVTGSFIWLAVISTLARLIVYSLAIAALPKLERDRASKLPIYAMMAAGLAICLWAALQSEWASWRMLLILIAAGTLLYFAARFAGTRVRTHDRQRP
jgi:amino acid transporter